MITYRYKAKSPDGADVAGIVQAADEYQAVTRIKEKYPIIISIAPVKEKGSGLLAMDIGSKKLDYKNLSIACSQIAITLQSGIPLARCLEQIGRQTEDKKLKRLLLNAADDVADGNTLTSSFERSDLELPATLIETIRAGEETGNLQRSFDTMAKYYDRANRTQQKIKQALTYPTFVIVIAIVVLIVVMTFVIPSLTQTFESLDAKLPAMTVAMINMSKFMSKWWPIVIIIIVALALFSKIYGSTEKGRIVKAKRQLKMPMTGKIRKMNNAAAFASTMAMMLQSGITVNHALEITAKTMDNAVMSDEVSGIVGYVEEGVSLGKCLKSCEHMPETLVEMTAIGEETGELESTLRVVGDFYANEADHATKQALAKLEPAILIVLAIFTAFIVISIYLPMFTMYNYM
ncbi:MAG: type II secretion system F family protein [Solobacterium sp.]|jgi:type IV pilus assembly protein PilC|nr:type II secretion system F family protein [Solobacterium sp.]MCH4049227.1 type II secretion system F family protein [Solobacterium sp.]MCH4074019.1 type II secretion system F family protein [Solobacterium sp.]MCI1314270.1 type II secretion system F family protein [Solobacterium sp.]MCI1346406.1 type II secretion system F family protein [Solobacterium sp.]